MKILAIDPAFAALDWYMRCQDDGHEVKVFVVQNDKTKNIGKGLVDFVPEWRKWMKWADMVFLADNTKFLKEIDAYRKQGVLVCGPTFGAAEWELDRGRGVEIFEECEIPVIPSEMFTSYDKAIEYVKKMDKRLVSKPCGDADKALSYCSKSPEDMVYMLERWKKNNKLKGEFILQEFKPGIEMAVGGWIGPGGFSRGWCENWEFKKLMNDDLGVATGEQGTVMRYVEKSLLADKVLAPCEDALVEAGHIGYVDVNCIIDEDGNPWPMEFTMRPGYPCFNIQEALHTGDHAQWLKDLAEGKETDNLVMNKVATGVVMSIPDYPYSLLTRKDVTGIPLYGLTPQLEKHVHPAEMMLGEAPMKVGKEIKNQPMLVSAGDYILVATGTGKTVKESSEAAYKVLKALSMPNSPMYRTDIGKKLEEQLPRLQEMGYATSMEFGTTETPSEPLSAKPSKLSKPSSIKAPTTTKTTK